MTNESLISVMLPAVKTLEDQKMQKALQDSLENSRASIEKIENCFENLASNNWNQNELRTFFNVWKHTHLKMLPIYGLSCRILKLATESPDGNRDDYFLSATKNAQTSYEDLNIEGFEDAGKKKTHADLYNELAHELCEGDEWQLSKYATKEGKEFSTWIYDNMVYQDLQTGLFTNLFSEVFNHGEYTIALSAFRRFLKEQKGYDNEKTESLALYVKCHVTSGVEVDHFQAVAGSLDYLVKAEKSAIDYSKAEAIFTEYLYKMGKAMEPLFSSEKIAAG